MMKEATCEILPTETMPTETLVVPPVGRPLTGRGPSHRPSSPWTAEMVAELHKLWDEGYSASQIANKLGKGISRSAILGKAHRLQLVLRNEARATLRSSRPVLPDDQKPRKVVTKMRSRLPFDVPHPTEIPRPTPAPDTQPVTLMMLELGKCRYPMNDGGPFLFCGAPSKEGSPYCPYHDKRCYNTDARR